MVSPRPVSPELLLWSQSLLVWSVASYGVMADPLKAEVPNLRWKRLSWLLASRAVMAAALGYILSQSLSLSVFLLLITPLQPILRYRLPMRWLAEFETLWISAWMVLSLELIRQFQLAPQWTPGSLVPSHLVALCILVSTLLLVVRGGTYIVRGILRKSGSLPLKQRLKAETAVSGVPAIAAAAEEVVQSSIDVEEYNRGRLIGNLERIVLTIVVAAGSYAALAFLVAAKGVVRSDEFGKSREFTEYFLIGSLTSVLVALCAGLALRFALVRLWPDLLTLQMQ